jgi:hypothetical protein
MRIISDYKDYYDSLQDYSDSIAWERKYNSIIETDSVLKNIWEKIKLFNYNKTTGNSREGFLHTIPVILGFCGEYFKYIIETSSNSSSQVLLTDDFFYPKDKFIYELKEVTLDNDIRRFFSTSYFNLDISSLNTINLFARYNSPILLIHPLVNNRKEDNNFKIVVNPSLKKLGYHKKKDIQQVYQELDMYVSGVLTNKEDRPELDEKHRKGARFDKYSFRRLPENDREHN